MTEDEWLTSLSPVALLHHLSAKNYERKPLLYAVAVCKREPELLTEPLRVWLDAIERLLTGEALDGLQEQPDAVREALELSESGSPETRDQYAAIADVVLGDWMATAKYHIAIPPEELEPVRRANADLVRDIFGNPFRPMVFAQEWRTGTAVAIAKQMYESRDFGAMPILADALQDAGCDSEEVLAHCRDPHQVHVRGCWVVDLVLGYE